MFSGSHWVNNPTRALSLLELHPYCSLTRLLHASVQSLCRFRFTAVTLTSHGEAPLHPSSTGRWGRGHHGPRTGSRPSPPPWPPDWLAFVPTLDALQEVVKAFLKCSLSYPKIIKSIKLTVDHQLGRVTVPLPYHVRPHAHIHPGVALPGVRDHQFAAAHLENSSRDKQEITGAPRMPAQCW